MMNVLRVFIVRDQLAPTLTASAFALIGPAACYAGVHTQAKSVHQNCVREMCIFVFNHSAIFTFFIYLFVEFGC